MAAWLGLVWVGVGYLGPWIHHRSVALMVTGFELAEFSKFFPQVEGFGVPIVQAFFYLPFVVGLILLSFFAGRARNRLLRCAVALGCALLLVVTLLPYFVIESARHALATRTPLVVGPQYTRQLILLAVGVLLTLLAPLAGVLPARTRLALVLSIALVGVLPTLWQFLYLRPLVSELYKAQVGVGWGVFVCALGFMCLLLGGGVGEAIDAAGTS